MTKMEYAQKVAEMVNGEAHEVKKNNGVVYTGVTVKVTENIAPTMYIDEFYKREMNVEEVAEIIKSQITKVSDVSIDVNVLDSFENAKASILIKMVNEKNADDEFVYESAGKYGYDDLILMPVVVIDISNGKGSTKISKAMLENWGVTAEEVIRTGIENISCVVEPLAKRLSRMTGMPEEIFDDNPIVIVSTDDGINGASAIIKAKDELEQMFPDGYAVIPSSIHEMLVVPYNVKSEQELSELVNDVNSNVLGAEDYLSDNVYKFVA